MKLHPLALLIPAATDADFRSLREGIEQHGQREPIVLLDGQVLDGRNRLRACEGLGIEPVTREFGSRPGDGDDPLAFVLDTNARRRHMNTTQRAKAAASLVEEWGDLRSRGSSTIVELPGQGRGADAKAGDVFGISKQTVYRARRVKRCAPDLFDLMDGVTLKLNGAMQMMRARERRQPAVPRAGERQRTPAVHPSDDKEAQRNALARLTAVNSRPPWTRTPSVRRSTRHSPTSNIETI